MFKGNAAGKYKQLINCLTFVQAKCGQANIKLSSIRSDTCFSVSKEALSVLAIKLTAKVEATKKNAVTFKLKLGKNCLRNATGLTASISVFKSDPVTISGYNKHDYEFLKLLGVFDSASKDVDASKPLNDSKEYLYRDNLELLTNASSNAINEQQSYPSIFDNIPTERNDLYTSTANFFNDTFYTPIANFLSNNEYPTENPIELLASAGDGLLITKPDSPHSEPPHETVSNLEANNNSVIFESSAEPNVVVEPIPEPPEIPDAAVEAASQLNALGEQTFESLGLGGWTPVGIVQNCFEYLHVGLGVPWWEAIAIGTLVIRFAMFPLVIMAQRNAAKMNNHLPQMQAIQLKITEARQSGNQMEVARYSHELMEFMKEKQLNPLKNMIVPLAQMPIFISFFMGLRGMCNVPVESLRSGGLFWFSDLTVPDQFFGLPIITTLTLFATIELGTDAGRLSSQNLQTMKYVLRALPFIILPFTVNFPAAILCYWVSSNFISLAQVGFLKIPAVRNYFKIEPTLTHAPETLPIKNKGFVGGLKESWTNLKITKELEERRRLDEMQFLRAGKGPLVKTYKYDPTKLVTAIKAKSAIKNS